MLWQILQHIGGYYVDHVVRHAQETSGLFAFVLGLLTWLYLGGQVTLFAMEVNVVRARRLWPRSFFSAPLLDADRRALTSLAEVEERVDEENVGLRGLRTAVTGCGVQDRPHVAGPDAAQYGVARRRMRRRELLHQQACAHPATHPRGPTALSPPPLRTLPAFVIVAINS